MIVFVYQHVFSKYEANGILWNVVIKLNLDQDRWPTWSKKKMMLFVCNIIVWKNRILYDACEAFLSTWFRHLHSELIYSHIFHIVVHLCHTLISQTTQCTCLISYNAPFRTEISTFLFRIVHCRIRDRRNVEFPNLAYYVDVVSKHGLIVDETLHKFKMLLIDSYIKANFWIMTWIAWRTWLRFRPVALGFICHVECAIRSQFVDICITINISKIAYIQPKNLFVINYILYSYWYIMYIHQGTKNGCLDKHLSSLHIL